MPEDKDGINNEVNNEASKETISKNSSALLDVYLSLGEVGRKDMEKKYPYLDFNELMFEREQRELKERGEINNAQSVHSSGSSAWIKILQVAAWLIFGIMSFFGIIGFAMTVTASTILPALLILVTTVGGGLVALAATMVFLNLAKNISQTAKDTADIKEILKNK